MKYKPAIGSVSEFLSSSIFWTCISCISNCKTSTFTQICVEYVVTVFPRNCYKGSYFGGNARQDRRHPLRRLFSCHFKNKMIHLGSWEGSLLCITEVLNSVFLVTAKGHSIISAKGNCSYILRGKKNSNNKTLCLCTVSHLSFPLLIFGVIITSILSYKR